MRSFFRTVRRLWKKSIGRRSQRERVTWESCERMLEPYPLPRPVVVHSVYRRLPTPA